MTVEKVSLSFERGLAERARQVAEARGQSLSAFVAGAVEHRLKLRAAGTVEVEQQLPLRERQAAIGAALHPQHRHLGGAVPYPKANVRIERRTTAGSRTL